MLTDIVKFGTGDAHVMKMMFIEEKKAKLRLNFW